MFDFAWSEIALIGVVALVLIGPKDMPVAIKAVSGVVKKARRMAAEFQGHVDEMMRDSELAEVRRHIADIRNLNVRDEFERHVDPDGSLKQSFADPFVTPPPPPVPEVTAEPEAEFHEAPNPVALAEPAAGIAAPHDTAETERNDEDAVPAFIPPAFAAAREAPEFIPPAAALPLNIRRF
jgi:sec-independent protein translocase protein TatB